MLLRSKAPRSSHLSGSWSLGYRALCRPVASPRGSHAARSIRFLEPMSRACPLSSFPVFWKLTFLSFSTNAVPSRCQGNSRSLSLRLLLFCRIDNAKQSTRKVCRFWVRFDSTPVIENCEPNFRKGSRMRAKPRQSPLSGDPHEPQGYVIQIRSPSCRRYKGTRLFPFRAWTASARASLGGEGADDEQ